jgi:hypothetical protein
MTTPLERVREALEAALPHHQGGHSKVGAGLRAALAALEEVERDRTSGALEAFRMGEVTGQALKERAALRADLDRYITGLGRMESERDALRAENHKKTRALMQRDEMLQAERAENERLKAEAATFDCGMCERTVPIEEAVFRCEKCRAEFGPHERPWNNTTSVHILHHGQTLCGALHGKTPSEWPQGHAWAHVGDRQAVNCVACLAADRAKLLEGT